MIFADPSNSRIKFLLCCFLNSHFVNNPFLLQVQGVLGLQGIHCLWKYVSVCAGGVQLVLLLGSSTVKNGHDKSHWRLGDLTLLVSPQSGTACIVSLHHSIKNNNLDLIGLDLIHAVREDRVLPWGVLVPFPLLWCCGGVKNRSGSRHTHVRFSSFILAACWAQHTPGWVGSRAAGGGWGCPAPPVSFMCCMGTQQCWGGAVEPLGSLPLHPCAAWRKPWAQGNAKFTHRLGLFKLPSDCNGGDCPKVASLATVLL